MYLLIKEFARKDYANLTQSGQAELAAERRKLAEELLAKRKSILHWGRFRGTMAGIETNPNLSPEAIRQVKGRTIGEFYNSTLKDIGNRASSARQKILEKETGAANSNINKTLEEIAKKENTGGRELLTKKGGKVVDFFKNHKKALGITGASALAAGGGYLAYRHYKNKKKENKG